MDHKDIKNFFSNAPVEKTIKWNGVEEKFYFRRLTGAERLVINRGQKINVGEDGKHTLDLDLADIESKRHYMVLYSCVNSDGSQLFKKIEQVREQPELAIKLLGEHAEDVNKDIEDTGKG